MHSFLANIAQNACQYCEIICIYQKKVVLLHRKSETDIFHRASSRLLDDGFSQKECLGARCALPFS